MTTARAIMLAMLVATAAPLPAARALTPVLAPGLVTTQLVPNEPEMRRPTVCTEQYLPVCGRLNAVTKTYPNACYARAAGAEVIAQGPCDGKTVPPAPR